jgi:hypothetical protein
MRIVTALFLACLASCGAAQTLLSPQAFLDRVEGRTVEARSAETGALVGLEHFYDRARVLWKPSGGACVTGSVRGEENRICFRYDRGRGGACWWPFLHEGRLMVQNSEAFGDMLVIAPSRVRIDCRPGAGP